MAQSNLRRSTRLKSLTSSSSNPHPTTTGPSTTSRKRTYIELCDSDNDPSSQESRRTKSNTTPRSAKSSAATNKPVIVVAKPQSKTRGLDHVTRATKPKMENKCIGTDAVEEKGADEAMQIVKEAFMEDLTCSLCLDLFITPVQLTCGHVFCRKCVSKWIYDHGNCPHCRGKAGMNNIVGINGLAQICTRFAELFFTPKEAAEHLQREQDHRAEPPKPENREQNHREQGNREQVNWLPDNVGQLNLGQLIHDNW